MERSGRNAARYAALVAALTVILLAPARGDEQRPLLKLAETLCARGEPADDSALFTLFKLRGPFLFISSEAHMLAMSGRNCHNLRRAEPESVLLVLGYREQRGVAVFFLTSMGGHLLEAARGIAVPPQAPVFIAVPLDEVRDQFERVKTFWLKNIDLSPAALRNH